MKKTAYVLVQIDYEVTLPEGVTVEHLEDPEFQCPFYLAYEMHTASRGMEPFMEFGKIEREKIIEDAKQSILMHMEDFAEQENEEQQDDENDE